MRKEYSIINIICFQCLAVSSLKKGSWVVSSSHQSRGMSSDLFSFVQDEGAPS